MDLSTAQQILVIILASALAIFLVLSIVAAVMVVRLLAMLRMVANKAEHIIESVESVGDVFRKTAGPLGVFRFVRSIVDMVGSHNQDKRK
ncbi:MAG: hypothetical protein ABWX94_00990 [Candidatus Saccharimonadales bacterium]